MIKVSSHSATLYIHFLTISSFDIINSPTSGYFMEAAGVRPGDSRDEKGRPRFFPFIPSDVVVPKMKNLDYWYWENLAHDHEQVSSIPKSIKML